MNRILVSPKAVTLACALYELTRDPGEKQVEYSLQRVVALDNAALMAAAGLTRDTLFRALVELRALGAVSAYEKPRDGIRRVTVDRCHWLFVSLAQRALVTVGEAR